MGHRRGQLHNLRALMEAPPHVFVCCRRDCAQGCGPAVRHPKEEPQWAQGPDGEGAAAACRIEGHRGGCLCCVCCVLSLSLAMLLLRSAPAVVTGGCMPAKRGASGMESRGGSCMGSHVQKKSTPSVRWLHGGFDVVSGGAKIAVVSCCAVPCSAGSQSRPGSRSCQQQTHGHPDRPWRHNMLCCAVP